MGTALRFDGVDDYVEIVDASIPASAFQNGFTLSAWINPFTLGESSLGNIIDKSNGINGLNGFCFQLTGSNQIRFRSNTVSHNSSAGSILLNRMTFVAVSVDSTGTATLYINGVQDGVPTATGSLTAIVTTSPVRIGNRATGTDRTFHGIIDEPRIFAGTLTSDEHSNLYRHNIVPRTSLVAEYLFNEASGTTALDTSGNGNDGSIVGPTYTTDVPSKARLAVDITTARKLVESLGGADFSILDDYSNCFQNDYKRATPDTFVRRINSTVGKLRAIQLTAAYQPILRHKFSYSTITSSTTGEDWTFTGTAIAGRAGIRIDASGEKYYSTGTVGNTVTTPDAAANSFTGDFTLVAKVLATDWTPSGNPQIIAKWVSASNKLAYRFYLSSSARLVLAVSSDGSTTAATYSSEEISPAIPDGSIKWIRASLDATDGTNSLCKFYLSDDGVTWAQSGATKTSSPITIFDSSASVELGSVQTGATDPWQGRIYYAAAYANDTGTGTPAFEFYPQRDCTNFPMNPYLDFDGTDDRLETNIAPGSYEEGYLCGGWAQMEAIGANNTFFGTTNSAGVKGLRFIANANATVETLRGDGVGVSQIASLIGSEIISQYVPFVSSHEYEVSGASSKLNNLTKRSHTIDRDFRGTTQVALLGAANNTTSGVVAQNFMQGSMFSQIWLPVIPTDEQQEVIRAYVAEKAGVEL